MMQRKTPKALLIHVFIFLILWMGGLKSNLSADDGRNSEQAPVIVFAAASLKNALDEIVEQWQQNKAHQAPILLSYASSGKLARQIEQGAPSDIYISANRTWVDYLKDQNAVDGASEKILLDNELVLIAHDQNLAPIRLDQNFDIKPLLGDDYFAMGNVASVPAGIYGKQALQYYKLWHGVQENLVQSENVRAALNLVLRGEAAFGIVYKSDVIFQENVKILAKFPSESHAKIQYSMVKINQQANKNVQDFYEYLLSPIAKTVFKKHGFGIENK